MVKLSEKTQKRLDYASAFLGLGKAETMFALLEMGLSVLENKYQGGSNANQSKNEFLQSQHNASVSNQRK